MNYKGKYVRIDPNNPSGLRVCQRSGFVFNVEDTVYQKDWKGDGYIWTGLIVGKPFVDQPQEQNRPPLVKADPYPIKDPRPPIPYIDPENNPVLPTSQLLDRLRNFNWTS